MDPNISDPEPPDRSYEGEPPVPWHARAIGASQPRATAISEVRLRIALTAPREEPWWFEPLGTWEPPEEKWGDEVPMEARKQGGNYINKLSNQRQKFEPLNIKEIQAYAASYQAARIAQWPWAYADLVLGAYDLNRVSGDATTAIS